MPKKKSVRSKSPVYHQVLKHHFPTFYEQPVLLFIILFVLISIFWIMRLGL